MKFIRRTAFATLLIAVAATLSSALSSCNSKSDDVDTITEQSFLSCFGYVSDMSTATSRAYSDLSYKVQFNYTRMTANVYVSNLRLTDGSAYPTLCFADVPFTIEKSGWKVATAASIMPTASAFGPLPVCSSFTLRVLDRVDDSNNYVPGFFIRFIIDGKYAVASSYPDQLLVGTTKSTAEGVQPFETKESAYSVSLNFQTQPMTARILIKNAQFAPKKIGRAHV